MGAYLGNVHFGREFYVALFVVFLFFLWMKNWNRNSGAVRRLKGLKRSQDSIDALHMKYVKGRISREKFVRVRSRISKRADKFDQRMLKNERTPGY